MFKSTRRSLCTCVPLQGEGQSGHVQVSLKGHCVLCTDTWREEESPDMFKSDGNVIIYKCLNEGAFSWKVEAN
jgi:hypothetical protein